MSNVPGSGRPYGEASLATSFQQAMGHHRAGRLGDAQAAYLTILRTDPTHFDALHMLGVLFAQIGRKADAAELIAEAIRINATSPAVFSNYGNVLLDLGRAADALASYDKAIALKPNYPEAYYNRGNALHAMQRYAEALASHDRAIALKSDYAEAYYGRGNAFQALNRMEEAIASYDRALVLRPQYAKALYDRGVAQQALGRHGEAVVSYERALGVKPDFAEAAANLGVALHALGRFAEAAASYDRALAALPDDAKIHCNRASALEKLERNAEALAEADRALELSPGLVDALNLRGNALYKLKRSDEAVTAYGHAIAARPDYALAYNNRGNVLMDLQKPEDALADYEKALALDPNYSEVLVHRANVLRELRRFDEASRDIERAFQINPDSPEAYHARAQYHLTQKNFDAALADTERALALKPSFAEALFAAGSALLAMGHLEPALAKFMQSAENRPQFAEAYCNQGRIFLALHRLDEAVAALDQAIVFKPDYAEAYYARGNCCLIARKWDEAISAYRKTVELRPDFGEAAGLLFLVTNQLCDWKDRDGAAEDLIARVEKGQPLSTFIMFAVADDAELHQKAAVSYAKQNYPVAAPVVLPVRNKDSRIRLGYVSSDYRNHPVAYLSGELFEKHDRSKFDLTAVSLTPPDGNPVRQQFEKYFDRFIDVWNVADDAAARMIADAGIDIVIDLNGLTQDCRTGIFARRPAPVSVNYLGFAGTMGASYYDYIIADPYVITDAAKPFFNEKIVFLPDSYMVTDSRRVIGAKPSRAEAGLPEKGIVFCGFHNSFKLAPQTFDVWMRLLKKVEGSVLWLNVRDEIAIANLRREAEARGVDSSRLVFAGYMADPGQYLAWLGMADIFLDTLPYNAHATACDTLWAGVPVVSCPGKTFPSRVAGSLLNALDMPELMAGSLAEYEALALKLATDPAMLASVRGKLSRHRTTKPLFDSSRFRRHIESAYETMWERHLKGLPPEDFAVKPKA